MFQAANRFDGDTDRVACNFAPPPSQSRSSEAKSMVRVLLPWNPGGESIGDPYYQDELRRTMILMTYILWYLFNLPFLKLTSSPLKITGIGRWTFPLRGGKNSAYFSEAYPYEVFNGGCYHHSIKTGSQKSQKSTRIANLTWCQHGKIGTRQSMKLFDKLQQHRPVVNPRR